MTIKSLYNNDVLKLERRKNFLDTKFFQTTNKREKKISRHKIFLFRKVYDDKIVIQQQRSKTRQNKNFRQSETKENFFRQQAREENIFLTKFFQTIQNERKI